MVNTASLAVIEKCKLLETSTKINQCLDGIIQDQEYGLRIFGIIFIIGMVGLSILCGKKLHEHIYKRRT